MKKIYLLIFCVLILVLAIFVPLSNRAVRVVLNEAESRMTKEPERALELLDSIAGGQTDWPRAVRARFALLYTQARDKNYIDVDNDSLIVRAVDYYRDHGDHRTRAMAYYYHAVIRHNAGDIDGAMEALVKAQLEAEACDDSYLHGLIYSELGNAYYEQNTYGEAIEMYTLAVDAFEQCGHRENMFIALNSKGMAFYLNKQNTAAIPYLEQALNMAEEMNDTPAILETSAALCQIVLDQNPSQTFNRNLYDRLKYIHKKYMQGIIPPEHYLMFGNILIDDGDIDSAKYYIKQYLSWSSEQNFSKSGAYALLASVESPRGNYKDAYIYEKLHLRYCDSVNAVFRKHEVRGLERKYKNEELKASYKSLQVRHRYERIGVVFLFCLFGAAVWWVYRYYMRKQMKEREAFDISMEEFRRHYDELKGQYNQLTKNRMANDERFHSLLTLFDKRMTDLKQITEWASVYEKNPDKFYKKVKEYFLLSEKSNRELVNDVLSTANLYCFGIIDYLRSICPSLSSRELCYCGLVCLGFTPECIRILFNHTNVYSIYTIRNKIRDKLELKKSSFNLEKHIQDLQEATKHWIGTGTSDYK